MIKKLNLQSIAQLASEQLQQQLKEVSGLIKKSHLSELSCYNNPPNTLVLVGNFLKVLDCPHTPRKKLNWSESAKPSLKNGLMLINRKLEDQNFSYTKQQIEKIRLFIKASQLQSQQIQAKTISSIKTSYHLLHYCFYAFGIMEKRLK